MTRRTLAVVCTAIIFLVLGTVFGASRMQPTVPPDSAAAQLFTATLPDATGAPQSLSQWQDKVVIVNFWATWCAPCVEEMPELSALQSGISKKNIQLIGLGIDSPENIKKFASKYKISYPLYVAGMQGSELSRQLGNRSGGLPFTVLIGKDGQVRKTYLGRLKMEQLRADLKGIQG